MPRRDGTGPMGMGPNTGRGLGACSGRNAVRYSTGLGLGLGLGFACRRGFRGGFGSAFSEENDAAETRKDRLLQQKDLLQKTHSKKSKSSLSLVRDTENNGENTWLFPTVCECDNMPRREMAECLLSSGQQPFRPA
jgi:hypothetical protein